MASKKKDDHWIEKAKAKGDIKEGTFTAKAKKAGKSVSELASEKADAPGKTGKQARLAQNFAKMRKGKK